MIGVHTYSKISSYTIYVFEQPCNRIYSCSYNYNCTMFVGFGDISITSSLASWPAENNCSLTFGDIAELASRLGVALVE